MTYRWCQSNAFEIWEDEAEQQDVLGMADFDKHCFRYDVDFEEIKSVRTGKENMERIGSQERGSFQWSTGKIAEHEELERVSGREESFKNIGKS